MIALKNPGMYKSVSAFSPIVAPTHCPWGTKAFTGYLGDNKGAWEQYDTCCLIAKAAEKLPLLVDQGLADKFLEEQLKSHLLKEACEKANHPLTLRMQEGYDHSYYFIATFIEDHIKHHAKALNA
jgi:S-formylglutathione hydrolase